MTNLNKEFREFEGLLRQNHFLLSHGFHLKHSGILHGQDIADRLVLVFLNNNRNRVLQYTFSLGSKKSGPYLMIDVINKDGEEISLDDYVEHNNLLAEGALDPFLLNSYQGNFIEQLRQAINYIDNVLATHLFRIVTGHDWLEIPFDWKGYR